MAITTQQTDTRTAIARSADPVEPEGLHLIARGMVPRPSTVTIMTARTAGNAWAGSIFGHAMISGWIWGCTHSASARVLSGQ